uniref:Tyr recombinase domain-containing protein n=1 Tax=Cacopsylla melanoneura TaxID=428564 RepID=A0A8D8Q9G0_9HEMI
MDMSSLWTRLCPPGICSALELGGLDNEKERDSHTGVSGRLSLSCARSLSPPDANRLDSESVGSPRLGCEPGEVDPDSNSEDRLPRYILGHSAAPHFPSIQQSFSVGTATSEVYPLSPLESEVSSEYNRFVEFRGVHSSLGPSSSEGDSDSQSLPTSSVPSSPSSHSLSSPVRVEMVPLQSEGSCSPSSSHRPDLYVHRCLGRGLGSCVGERLYSRSMDSEAALLAYQPERVVCGSEGDSILPQSGGEPLSSSTVRQQDCCGLHSQTRGAPLSYSPERNKEVTVSDIQAEHSYHSSLHTGKVQLSRRRSLSASSSPRLACSSTVDQVSVPPLGSAGHRPICDLSVESRPALCVVRSSRQTGGLHRCVFQGLEGLEARLGFPSSSPSSTSAPSFESSDRSVYSGSPAVAENFLAGRPQVSSNSSPVRCSRPSFTGDRLVNRPSASSGREPDVGDLADTGWNRQVEGWSETEKCLLTAAWRPSTRSTYRKPWSRWVSWASSNNLNISNPLPKDLAKFLAHLFSEKKFSLSSILLHKSVVATMSDPDKSASLSSHPIVSKMIKGIGASQPPKPVRTIWNVSDLRSWMESFTPSLSSYFEVARHLALLLLLLSGRRVHDLTLLQIDSSHLQCSPEFIIFWPAFGSKTDSTSFQQSGWRFSTTSVSNTWNVAYWTNVLLSLRSARCGSLNLAHLFITSRGNVRPASRTIIAGWVSSALSAAGIPFPAGSIRSAVNSSLARANLPLDMILSRGNWRSADTFLKHYYRPLAVSGSANQPDTCEGFSPVP